MRKPPPPCRKQRKRLARAQEAADEAANRLSQLSAQRGAIERTINEHKGRIQRLDNEFKSLAGRRQNLLAMLGDAGDGVTLAAAVEAAVKFAEVSEHDAGHSEAALRVARQVETDKRSAYDDARRATERLQTEVRTLTNFLRNDGGDLWPAVVDALMVEPGYEAALAAALGDDIEASSDEGAPIHWRGLPPLSDMATLPGDATPLSKHVDAPPALARVLAHVGVVSKAVGAALQPQLRPGQKLVTKEGDVWRWDGFVSAADAPSAAAKRLAERNRLTQLEASLVEAQAKSEAAKAEFDQARTAVETGVRSERDKREAWRAAGSALEVARRALQTFERKQAEQTAQTSALDEAQRRTDAQLQEVNQLCAAAELEFAALPALDGLNTEVARLRDALNRARSVYGEARARHDSLEREAKMRADRLSAIDTETQQWISRAAKARDQMDALTARASEAEATLSELTAMPQQLADKRFKLLNMLSEAERDRKAAADALQEAENAVRAADSALREAQENAGNAREEHARLGARLEASQQRKEHCQLRITETLNCGPDEILAQAGVDADKLPGGDEIERS